MNMSTHAYDLTHAERIDAFGTADMDELIAICVRHEIPFVTRQNRFGIVIWRCHLTRHFELRLQAQERQGVRYTESWRSAS